MGDENDYLNFEEDRSVHRPSFNDGSSPLSDLRNQLQILNLGDGSKAKSKNRNFLSAPLQSIENLDSEEKKTQSNAFASDFNSFFSNVENEGNNRNVLDVFSSNHSGFESCLDTFLNGAVEPSSSRRSLSDLESLMSDSVRPTPTEMISTPPKSTKNEDLPLYSPFISPLDEIFGASSNNTEDVQSELLVSTLEVTETLNRTTCAEENSGQLLLRIATPYKTKTISVHGLDSEESEYSKKRDFLMQSDKKLYGKIEAKNAQGKGRSLTAQMNEALSDKKILSDGKKSTVVPVIQKEEDENNAVTMNIRDSEISSKTEDDGVKLLEKDEITDSQSIPTTESCDGAIVVNSILKSTEKSYNASPKKTNTVQRILHFAETSSLETSNANTNSGPPVGTSFLSGSELNRIRESIKKDLEMLPQKLPTARSDSAGEVGADINSNKCPVSIFVPESTETEGRKQVTFALSDEVIQPSTASNSDRSRLKTRKNSFKSKSSDEILESRYWCPSPLPEDSDMFPLAEPETPVVLDSDDEETFQSLSSSIVEETPFVGGTPLILRDLAIQLENSWLNFSYNNISPNLERTCVVDSDAPIRSLVASTSMSETIVGEPEESDSDESENFQSVNSTIPNIEDVDYDDSQSDDTPNFEDEGGSFDVYDIGADGTVTVSTYESACRKLREFKPDPRDFPIPHDEFYPVIAEKIHEAIEREDVSVEEEKEVHQKWDDMDASLTIQLTEYLAAVKDGSDGCTSTVPGQTETDESATDLSDEKNVNGHFEGVSKSSSIEVQLDETIINRSAECVVEGTKTSPTKSLDELISENENQIKEHESTGEYSSSSSTIELDENPGTKETCIDGDECSETPLANADDENPVSEHNIFVENERGNDRKFESDPTPGSSAVSDGLHRELTEVNLEDLLDVELANASMDVINITPITPESFVRHLNNYQPEKSSSENECSNDDAEITRILDELALALEDAESNIPHSLVSGEVNLVDPSVSETPLLEDSEVERIEMTAAVADVANGESHHQCSFVQTEADYENPPSLAAVLEQFDELTGKLSPIREEDSTVGDLNEVNTPEECSAQTMDDSFGNDAKVTRNLKELESVPSVYEERTTNVVHKSQIEELNISVDTTKTMTSRFSGEFEEREVLNASMHFRAEDTSLFSAEPEENWSPVTGERIIDLLNATNNLNENEIEEIVQSSNVTELVTAEPEGSTRSDILESVNDEFLPSFTEGNDVVAADFADLLIETVQNESEEKETNLYRSEGSPNSDVCNTSHTNEMNETRLLDTATDPQSPVSSDYNSESMELSVDQSPCDLNVTRQIPTELHADEQKLDVSILREARVRSSQDVPHVDVQEDECKNLSSPETSGSQRVYENCVQNATFDLIVSPQLRNIADTKEPSEVNAESISDLPRRAEGDQFVNVEVKTLNDEESVANVNSRMIISDERRSPTIETHTENSGASAGVSYADLALPDPSSVVPPLSTHDSLSETKVWMTVSDCDTELAKRDPSSVADIVNRVVVENLPYSEPEPSDDVGSFVSDPFTPMMPRLQSGLTASSTKAAKDKIQRSLDLLLTPLRQNISRLCTPMNATHQRDLSELEPSVTLEQCENSNKTRLVVELPTNLLDISISTLDDMFQLGTTSAVDTEEESAEKDQTATEKAAIEAYEKLAADYEQLKKICLIQRRNEKELERAYEQAEDVIREQANRYEMFKDYMNRYISYMNDEYEKLEAKLANKT